MRALFADTFYWIALTNPADEHAQDIRRFDHFLSSGKICTTDEILTEVLTFFSSDNWLRGRAVQTVREIMYDDMVQVFPQSHQTFLAGFDLYASRPDKGYSLTDCISMFTMRREGISAVLTNDRHFEQEGFEALLRG